MFRLTRNIAYITLSLMLLLFSAMHLRAQDSTAKFIPVDSLQKVAPPAKRLSRFDSVMQHHSPRKATIRSAIIPGWGQAYNKKYWKIPIVYGVLAIPGSILVYNLKNYRAVRYAYKARYLASSAMDSSLLPGIRSDLVAFDINSLRTYRDQFRKSIDYSVLFCILAWGLNVADATVDAHLRAFDIDPDLSFHLKFGHSDLAGTNGVSLVLALR